MARATVTVTKTTTKVRHKMVIRMAAHTNLKEMERMFVVESPIFMEQAFVCRGGATVSGRGQLIPATSAQVLKYIYTAQQKL